MEEREGRARKVKKAKDGENDFYLVRRSSVTLLDAGSTILDRVAIGGSDRSTWTGSSLLSSNLDSLECPSWTVFRRRLWLATVWGETWTRAAMARFERVGEASR